MAFIASDTDLSVISYPFRNEQNQRYTKQLFYEKWICLMQENRSVRPPFTLNMDRPGYINFGREYIDLGDPTGYKIAMKYFKEYSYWTFLMQSPWFREAKEIWDTELDAKLQSEGLNVIRTIANDETSKGQLQAARFLVDKGYKKETSKRGRPSAVEVAGALKQDKAEAQALEDDMVRIGLVK